MKSKIAISVITFVLLSMSAEPSVRSFWEVDVDISPPNKEVSELCDEYAEVYRHLARFIIPPEVMVTCFLNEKDLIEESPTIIYRVSIFKEYLPNIYTLSDFKKIKNDFISSSLEFELDDDVEYSEKLGLEKYERSKWSLYRSKIDYAIVNAISKFSTDKKNIESQVVVSGIVLIKGKVIFVRVTNSKNKDLEYTSKLAEKWIKILLKRNSS